MNIVRFPWLGRIAHSNKTGEEQVPSRSGSRWRNRWEQVGAVPVPPALLERGRDEDGGSSGGGRDCA